MFVHRAVTACPICNHKEEVWFYNSEIQPFSSVECVKCDFTYDAGSYITNLLELYENITVSTNSITSTVTN
jgi:endogenous inhibitor of DNA gyrase (YacG/DUF329 family)